MINLFQKKIFIFLLIFLNFFFLSIGLKSEINNKIIVKVGNEIITSLDLQNEILTNLVLNKREINQFNIDQVKDFSIKNLINKKIKQIEINRFEIKDYSKNDLDDYLFNIASKYFNTNVLGLKKIFQENKINFETFSENYEINLLWNTLIYRLYKNQLNINLVELENELNKFKKINPLDDLNTFKEKLLAQKKKEKLDLFSRSHFSNLENSIQINFL